jgi:hypothetical protein
VSNNAPSDNKIVKGRTAVVHDVRPAQEAPAALVLRQQDGDKLANLVGGGEAGLGQLYRS